MTRASTPPILRRGSKARRRRDSDGEYILSDYGEDSKVGLVQAPPFYSLSLLQNVDDFAVMLGCNSKQNGNSPIKQLPFSPSQFFNSPGFFDVPLSSTPVKRYQAQNTTPLKDRSVKPVSMTPSGGVVVTGLVAGSRLQSVEHAQRAFRQIGVAHVGARSHGHAQQALVHGHAADADALQESSRRPREEVRPYSAAA